MFLLVAKPFNEFLRRGKLVESIGLVVSDQDEETQSAGETAEGDTSEPSFYVVDAINVSVGQTVKRGDPICTLANQSELMVRGLAFESDFAVVNRLYAEQAEVQIAFSHDAGTHEAEERGRRVPISFVESTVDSTKQSLHFYMKLNNEIIGRRTDDKDRQFNSWQFRPGQRVHLRLPVESWSQQWKLPAGAVVTNGAESLVFRQTLAVGDRLHLHGVSPFKRPKSDHAEFEAVSVRVKYRDDRFAVLEDDGALAIGDKLVMKNAYQVHLAHDRCSAGAVDDHHGHSH